MVTSCGFGGDFHAVGEMRQTPVITLMGATGEQVQHPGCIASSSGLLRIS